LTRLAGEACDGVFLHAFSHSRYYFPLPDYEPERVSDFIQAVHKAGEAAVP
jgi:hypothetical protein